MKAKISALVDGELEAIEMREACAALRHEQTLRQSFGTYVLIGDALRQEPYLNMEMGGSVLETLAAEPVVLAPQKWDVATTPRPHWQRRAMAVAAGIAGVSVVAWIGLANQHLLQPQQLAAQQQPVVMASAVDDDTAMQEYLIAHQVHSGSVFLNGDAQHVRAVSMNGAELRR